MLGKQGNGGSKKESHLPGSQRQRDLHPGSLASLM